MEGIFFNNLSNLYFWRLVILVGGSLFFFLFFFFLIHATRNKQINLLKMKCNKLHCVTKTLYAMGYRINSSFVMLYLTMLLVSIILSSSYSNSSNMSSISSAFSLSLNVVSTCLNWLGSVKCRIMIFFFLSSSMTV